MAQAKKKTAKKKVTKKVAKKAAKKKTVKKTARRTVRKKAASRKTTRKRRAVSAEERHRMVAECAYFRAINSGPQSPEADRLHWLDAEIEIDALIKTWYD